MDVPLNINFIGRVGDTAPADGGCPIGGEFEVVSSADIFTDRRVVVFCVPGAFTPTCSAEQLPAFEQAYEEIRAYGVDEVYCLSVNDGFVMNAWFEKEGIQNVKPLCDGNGQFTVAMRLGVVKRPQGFGYRSWRYAMVVNNGTIEKVLLEPGRADDTEEDPYGESSPEKVIEFLKATLEAQ